MLRLFDRFPRQIAHPTRKNVKNREELLETVNKYNGLVKHIWVSLYNIYFVWDDDGIRHQITEEIQLDKGWFDFDGDRALHAIRMTHAWCVENHYKHIMFFSGGGFHIYILFKNFEYLSNPKQALQNFHDHVIKTLDFSVGDPSEGDFDVDHHCVGDISRVATFPGSYNGSRKRYCISVSEEDLRKGMDHIRVKAEKPHVGEYHWYGRFLYDIKQHDSNGSEEEIQLATVNADLKEKINSDKLMKELPECVSLIFNRKPKVGYANRWKTIVYLRDYGLSEKEVEAVLKKYLSPREFHHCVKEERMVSILFRRLGKLNDISYPTCDSLRRQGFCPFKTDCSKSRLLYK